MRRTVTSAPGVLEVESDAAPPASEVDGIRIGVEVVGLCGSDYAIFSGTNAYFSYPQVQGHEIGGRVLELPSGYEGPLVVGDRVAVEPTVACGHCVACRRGRYNCCVELQVRGVHLPGGFAEEIVVGDQQVHPVGDLDAELAALVEPMSIALQSVERASVAAGDRVLVLGAGPIGILVALAAADRGATTIVADRHPRRLAIAQRLGAGHTIDVRHEGLDRLDRLAEEVHRLTAGDGADVVIEATGASEMLRAAFDLVAHAGTIVVVGISAEELTVPVLEFSRKEVTVVGSRNNTGLFPQAIELTRRHRHLLPELITHRIPMAELQSTLELATTDRSRVGKVLVQVGSA